LRVAYLNESTNLVLYLMYCKWERSYDYSQLDDLYLVQKVNHFIWWKQLWFELWTGKAQKREVSKTRRKWIVLKQVEDWYAVLYKTDRDVRTNWFWWRRTSMYLVEWKKNNNPTHLLCTIYLGFWDSNKH